MSKRESTLFQAAVALRCGVDPVGLPVAVPAARVVRVWCGFPSGSFTVAHANSGRTCRPLTSSTSWARLRAAPEIAIQHETALIAAECPFGQAQFGFHHTTGRTGLGGGVPAVRDVQGAAVPTGFVLDLDPAG